jgi:hypothetical protein
MLAKKEKGKHAGTFNISADHNIFGELTINGSKSKLRLHSSESFPTHQIPDRCTTGILHNLTKVSLIDCVTPRVPGHSSGPKGKYYFARIFPHYVILGDQFIHPNDPAVIEVVIYLDDALTLFCDLDAFGAVFDAEPIVQQILEKEPYRKDRRTGPNAHIFYYAGHNEIVSTETAIGRVVVEHRPQIRGGSNRGLLRDKIAVSLRFQSPVLFHEAIRRAGRIIDYMGLLVGRSQNLTGLYLGTKESLHTHSLLTVHWVMYRKRTSKGANGKPSSYDVLLDGVREPDQFASVTASWLERQELWHDARWRFFNSYSEERHYDINRLVASANMFDILPQSAVPSDNPLSSEMITAQETCRKLFRELQESPERSSVLNALGRLGKSSLKRKVQHRANMLRDQAGEFFADLVRVSDAAVNCRNFYVHGTPGAFDYERNFDMVIFFIDSLEFVFAVSDLIEAGWDFGCWLKQGSSMTHPFGRYKVDYRANLNKLLSLLPKPN